MFADPEVDGRTPLCADLSNGEDQAKVGASVFAFVNVARFAVPLRVGLALSTTPWVDDNIVQPFLSKGDADDESK